MSGTPVTVTRTAPHTFVAESPRGGRVRVATDDEPDAFTPGELLLAAAAACAGLTAEGPLVRRVGQEGAVVLHADRTKPDDDPHIFASVDVSFDVDLSALGDEERDALLTAADRAIERLCTVTRTLRRGVPVAVHLP